MKTIIVEVQASWGFVGADRDDVFEIEVKDNATDEEIEKEAQEAATEWMWNYMDLGFQWRDKEGEEDGK